MHVVGLCRITILMRTILSVTDGVFKDVTNSSAFKCKIILSELSHHMHLHAL